MALNTSALAQLRTELQAAVVAEAGTILATAQARIPVDTGTARDSGRVVSDADTVWVSFGRDDDGGIDHAASNAYIDVLHEDLALRHTTGGAKFLSLAGDEATAGLAARIAAKVKL